MKKIRSLFLPNGFAAAVWFAFGFGLALGLREFFASTTGDSLAFAGSLIGACFAVLGADWVTRRTARQELAALRSHQNDLLGRMEAGILSLGAVFLPNPNDMTEFNSRKKSARFAVPELNFNCELLKSSVAIPRSNVDTELAHICRQVGGLDEILVQFFEKDIDDGVQHRLAAVCSQISEHSGPIIEQISLCRSRLV